MDTLARLEELEIGIPLVRTKKIQRIVTETIIKLPEHNLTFNSVYRIYEMEEMSAVKPFVGH